MFDQQSQAARVPTPLSPYHTKTQMFELYHLADTAGVAGGLFNQSKPGYSCSV